MIFEVKIRENGELLERIGVKAKDFESVVLTKHMEDIFEEYDIDPDYLDFDEDGNAEIDDFEISIIEIDEDDEIEDDDDTYNEYDFED